MGYPQAITKQALTVPTGGTLVLQRKAKQTAKQFAGMVATYRTAWKQNYGIQTRSSVVGDTATVFFISGLGKTSQQVGEMTLVSKRSKPDPAPVQAPPEPEPPKPEPVVDNDETRQLWKDVFLESLRVLPMAAAAIHSNNASAAVDHFGRRFGGMNHGNR